jgi:dTDP-4-amino-4,6-dideoxygalactose transaminase
MSRDTRAATPRPAAAQPVIPLHRPWIGAEEESAVLRVLRSGHLAGNGPECRALEAELAARLGAPAGGVLAVSSATHALELSMRLLGVQGGEVILPSFTFPSVGNAVILAGGVVRFCDVREPDLNLDPDQARHLIGPATRAVVVTHYAGHPVDLGPLAVPVVEDAAHAFGSRIDGRACGAIGALGCLSFHATKNLVAGEGGALIVRDAGAAARARILREKGTNRDDFTAGLVDHYAWVGPGSSLVMPELSAAVARAQLARYDAILEARRHAARLYDEGLADVERAGRLRIVRPVEGVSSHHVYAVLVDPARREHLLARLAEDGVRAASHFVPLHTSPFGSRLSPGLSLPVTERVAASIVRLPIYPGLTDADVHRVVDVLCRALDA